MFFKKYIRLANFFLVSCLSFLFFFNPITLTSQFKIISPKKSDTLISGRPTKICWEGNSSYPVNIDYTTDRGEKWIRIIENFYGNCYEWTPPVSDFENFIIKVTLNEYHSPALTKIIKPAHLGEINSVRFSKDYRYFLSSGSDSKVFLWDFERGNTIDSLIFPTANRVYSAEFFHNPDSIVVAYDSTAMIWIRKSNEIKNLPKFNNVVRSVAVHPKENIFAVSSYAGIVKIFRLSQEIKELNELFSKDSSGIYNVRFSPDGHFLHFSDYNGNTILLRSPFTGNDEIGIFSINQNRKGSVTWSADISSNNQFIATGGVDDTVRIWDISKNTLINSYGKHNFHIRSVNFHPTENVCLSGSLDGFIRQWDIFTLENFCEPINNKGQVLTSDYSFDGNYIISAGRDSAIKIWRNCYNTVFFDSVNVIVKNLIAVRIPHLISSPNKKITIPMIIENPMGFYSDKKIETNVKIELPNRLLQIKNSEFPISKSLTRKDTIVFLAEISLKGSFDTIKTLVLRGDRNSEEIRLLEFQPTQNLNLLIEKVDGSIRIEENCIGDYDKDILFSLSSLEIKVHPNPSLNGEIDLFMNLIEDGNYQLDLVTSDGKYQRLFERYYSHGDYYIKLNLSNYSNGVYFLRLKSPSNEVSQKLILLK
ncbi:MAG: T9SS type A sorting domain-containing protein [Candidatus Kapabacteria bacterium]|nr:T9SS type A sorting domain-containing protein [Candidatus Kapabacteria bacterium]